MILKGALSGLVRETLPRVLLGAVLGVIPALAFHPLDWPLVMAIGLAPILYVARRSNGERLVSLFFGFGVGYMSTGCAWLYGLFWFAGVGVALVASVLFFVPLGWTLGFLLRRTEYPIVLVAPVVWITFDFVRHWFMTGYPWLLPGHVLWRQAFLLGVVAFVGVYGLTFMLVTVNAALAAWVLGERRRFSAILAASTALACVVLGALGRVDEEEAARGPIVRVAAVQGNIGQFIKEEVWRGSGSLEQYSWSRHLRLTKEAADAGTDLIVWPETMLPGYADVDEASESRHRRWTRRRFAELATVGGGTPILIGAIRLDGAAPTDAAGRPPQYNAAILIDAEGEVVDHYDKVHRVPGGEFLPFRSLIPDGIMASLEASVRETAGFVPRMSAGEQARPVTLPSGVKVGPLICYEIAYPGLAREQANAGADVLVNLTNYAWYGTSAQLDQALAISAFRAVETRRPVVIAANTGISAWIDIRGGVHPLIVDGKRKEVAGVLLAAVPIGASGTTPYRAAGDLLAWACTLLTVVGVIVTTRRRDGRSADSDPASSPSE